MTTVNFCFYLQNRLIQTSQTGGQLYSATSLFSIPWFQVHRTSKNVNFHILQIYCCQKWVCETLSLFFFIFKKWLHWMLIYFLILRSTFLGVGVPSGCMGMFPKMGGGIQVLAGLAASSRTVQSLVRSPWPANLVRKFQQKVILLN